MRRKLFPFLCLLVGLYLGLGLMLRGVSNHEKHLVELEDQARDIPLTQESPLFIAIHQNDVREVARLLKAGADPNETDRGLRTPLLIAARNSSLALIRELITAGAKVNTWDRTGTTALLYAIKSTQHPAVIAYLMECGADVRHRDNAGETPLILASDSADTALMEALLTRGADVNVRDRIGLTPLMRVARGMAGDNYQRNNPVDPSQVRRSAMELLLKHGADVRIRDQQGWTALLYASENQPSGGVEVLLKHGADPNVAVKGRTPLRSAAYRGLVGNMQALLAAGARGGPADFSDALMQATLAGHDAAAEFLLDHGADVNYCDQYGMTPLMLAIANDHLSTGKVLVQHGANARMRDLLGKTALDYAQPGRNGAIHTEVFGDLHLRRF